MTRLPSLAVKFGAGALGALLVTLAAFGVDWRLGLLVAGGFLLLIDRRVP